MARIVCDGNVLTDEQLHAKLVDDIQVPPAGMDPLAAMMGALLVEDMIASLDAEYVESIKYLNSVKAELENRVGGGDDE